MGYRVNDGIIADESSDGNFILRHWRGHLSLPVSWFLVGGLLSAVLVQGLLLAIIGFQSSASSLRAVAIAWVLFFLFFILVRVWALVGIWRSAARHEARGGSFAWANIARFLLVIGVLGSLAQAQSYVLQVQEYASLAVGNDSLGKPAILEVADGGREIQIDGLLTVDTSQRLVNLASSLPELRSLHLESRGGRLFEAEKIADLTRERGLSTRVEQVCESACTIILLAGKERSAFRHARIGFHQPDFPGILDEDRQAAIDANSEIYRKAGINAAFIAQMMTTPPSQMWYPSYDELIDASVLTGSEFIVGGNPSTDALGREVARFVAEINEGTPANLDEATRLLNAEAKGHTVILNHKMRIPFDRSRSDELKAAMQGEIGSKVCDNEGLRPIIDGGGSAIYRYELNDGRHLFDISINGCA